MGQKVDPRGFRLGVIRDSDSVWFSVKGYSSLVLEDYLIRTHIKKKWKKAGVSSIKIKRRAKQVEIDVYFARPGVVIGKGGENVEGLKKELESIINKELQLNIREQEKSDMSAAIVAETIAVQLERRIAFRRAMKQAIARCLKAGAKGVRVCCSGRLNGAEIARTEWYREGRVPLHTLRSNIDYVKTAAFTTYGTIGIKVWVYKGDVFDKKEVVPEMEKYNLGPEVKEDVIA